MLPRPGSPANTPLNPQSLVDTTSWLAQKPGLQLHSSRPEGGRLLHQHALLRRRKNSQDVARPKEPGR